MIKFVLQSNINESSSISALANFWSCPLTPDPNPWWIKLPSVFGSSGIATKSERFKCGESTTICCCNSTGIAASASWTGEHRKYWEVSSSHTYFQWKDFCIKHDGNNYCHIDDIFWMRKRWKVPRYAATLQACGISGIQLSDRMMTLCHTVRFGCGIPPGHDY